MNISFRSRASAWRFNSLQQGIAVNLGVRPSVSPLQIIIYCGLLLSVSAFSVDILLPAFGLMAGDLDADYAAIQMAVPVFLAFIGIGQLFTGPMSDRFGRRPVLLCGLAAFAAGTVLCLFAQSAEMLLLGRAVQGIGASGGPVVARAILRDLFSGRQLAANIALATMVFAFGPIVAPLAGVAFMQFGSWRMIFAAILLFGLILLAVGLLFLPETLARANPGATRPAVLLANAITVLRNPQSRFYGLLLGPVMSLMMLILISIPRIYKDTFGIEGALFAALFAIHGIGIIIGQYFNRAMIHRHGPQFALLAGGVIAVGSVALMLAFLFAGVLNAYVLSFTMILFATSFMTMAANCMALSLDPHGVIAGFVSSFVESMSRLFSAVFSGFLALLVGGRLDHFLYALALTTLAVLGLILAGQRRMSA